MIRGSKIAVLILLLFSVTSYATYEVSVTCMKIYENGGAPAVLESQECPKWSPSIYLSPNRDQNCQFSTLQGRREYQEDRIICNLQLNVTAIGKDGPKEVEIGVGAIFDGHGGKEASELASNNFLDYFTLHVAFASYQQAFSCGSENNFVSQEKNKDTALLCGLHRDSSENKIPISGDVTFQKILKIALSRTFRDIDIKFTQEAVSKNYLSGSTATVVILANCQILVAHVGDTKALLCSKRTENYSEIEDASTTRLHVEELTIDHHPDREDEKSRIEAAGGFVRTWGVPRVNGVLAVSRAIGDLYLKRYGVSPVPEFSGWRNLTTNESYLVVASDGIFEGQTPQEVCGLIEIQEKNKSKIASTFSDLADHIVKKAYNRGSGDNLSVIVIPLQSHRSSQGSADSKCEF